MADSRILVVYYSRTGTTRKVAESLTTALRCDSEQILDAGSRSGILGYVRSLIEARLDSLTKQLVAEEVAHQTAESLKTAQLGTL